MAKSCELDGVLYKLTAFFLGGGFIAWLATGGFLVPLTTIVASLILKKVFASIGSTGRPNLVLFDEHR